MPRLLPLAVVAILLAALMPAVDSAAPPSTMELGTPIRDFAATTDGSLFVVATGNGAFGFAADGTQLFHALAGTSTSAVAADRRGDLLAVGTPTGAIHLLDGDGNQLALAHATASVDVLATSESGGIVVAGDARGMVLAFDPADGTPQALPDVPVATPILLPQWSYNTGAPVTDVFVSGDGQWIAAANEAQSNVWLWSFSDAVVPGGMLGDPSVCTPPLGPDLGPPCWTYQMSSAGGVRALSGARSSYDLLISFGTGWTIGTSASSFFYNPWNFLAGGAVASATYSAAGTHAAIVDAFGNAYLVEDSPHFPAHEKPALWSTSLPAAGVASAVSGAGQRAAFADADGNIRIHATGGALAGSFAMEDEPIAMAFTPTGSALVVAAGETLAFWS